MALTHGWISRRINVRPIGQRGFWSKYERLAWSWSSYHPRIDGSLIVMTL
jgi:hypothetical protein